MCRCNKTVSPVTYKNGEQLPATHTIDASLSYDKNLGYEVTGADAGLDISYAAFGSGSASCAAKTAQGSGDTFELDAFGFTGCTAQVSIRARKDERGSQTTCWIQVPDAASPKADASSDVIGKVNAESKLILRASFEASELGPIDGAWSLKEGQLADGQSLSDAARTDIYASTPAASGKTVQLDLVLAPFALLEKGTYLFQFAAAFDASGMTANIATEVTTIDVEVVVNGAPSSGVFTVEPDRGIVLVDTFTLSSGQLGGRPRGPAAVLSLRLAPRPERERQRRLAGTAAQPRDGLPEQAHRCQSPQGLPQQDFRCCARSRSATSSGHPRG